MVAGSGVKAWTCGNGRRADSFCPSKFHRTGSSVVVECTMHLEKIYTKQMWESLVKCQQLNDTKYRSQLPRRTINKNKKIKHVLNTYHEHVRRLIPGHTQEKKKDIMIGNLTRS